MTNQSQKVTSRLFRSGDDLLRMLELLMEARSSTDDWHYAHVGELLFNYLMVMCHLDPNAFIRLWYEHDRLVGYAILGEDPSFDLQVLPSHEWKGIEAEALEWAEYSVAELKNSDAQKWNGNLVSFCRQDNRKRLKFLKKHGFQPGGEFSEVNMMRSLKGAIPEAQVPAGCQVLSMADTNDIPNRAEACREVWSPWTVGNITNEDYAGFMNLPGYRRELDVVAVAPDGIIAAYVNGWIDPVNRIGDLGPVGARQAYRRQGLTRAVLIECMCRMRTLGMNRVCVSTGFSNLPAMNLYESVGFNIVNRNLEYLKTLS